MLENELAKSLNPIRNMFLAQVVHALFETNVFEELKGNTTQNIDMIAEKTKISTYRLEGLVLYLKHEGLVALNGNQTPFLTEEGVSLENSKPWYQLLVGGYGKTLLDLPAMLKDRTLYGSRVGESVGRGSCGISQFDALPMTKRLISKIEHDPKCIVDIGCGDGSYLVDLCGSFPGVQAIGIEPDESSVQLAQKLIVQNGLESRATIEKGDLEAIANLKEIPSETVFVVAFVLQEVLEQSGREKIVEVLQRLKNRHPQGRVVVIEVDRADHNTKKMTSELGLGYYNPYFLIHRLTEQRLETPSFWTELFAEAGWKVEYQVHPEPSYDSLELKIGYLLC